MSPFSIDKGSDVTSYAGEYIDNGFCPIPITFGSKRPTLGGWPDLRIERERVSHHFSGKNKNIGLLLGKPSGWRVNVDLDIPEARRIAGRFLTPTLTSGRCSAPNSHWWYVALETKTEKWKDTGGEMLLELRSTGHQTLVEPSVHPSGESYSWNRDSGPEMSEITVDDLVRRCRELATATLIARHLPAAGLHDHYALPLAGYLLKQGRLDEETTARILLAAWHAGNRDSAEACRDLEGIVRTTAKKLTAGEKVRGGRILEENAPGIPHLLARWWGWTVGNTPGSSHNDKKTPTHDELRDRWLEAAPPTAYGLGSWQRYKSGIWSPVQSLSIQNEICRVLEEAKPEGVKPTSTIINSVESLSRANTAVPDETWDSNKDILVCANGTLDISSGTLREHRQKDYASSAVPYAYDSDAAAPTWISYLNSTVPDAQWLLQEFAGYCLTSDTSHEVAVWLYGPPGSGKSTFIEGLTTMMGARAGVLGLADVQQSRFALGNLPGKTLLHATEQPSDYVRSTHILNSVISGEAISVEQKFKDPFTVVPRAKVCWAMNELPRVGETNSGLFRRVKVIAFPKLKNKRAPEIKKQIKEEGAGILVWALEGLYRLRERGHFEIPDSVKSATEEFRQTNDIPGLFVSEACTCTDTNRTQAGHLYEAYKTWCHVNGHKPLSSTAIAKDWVRLGFQKKRINGRHYYQGIGLDTEWSYEHAPGVSLCARQDVPPGESSIDEDEECERWSRV